MRAAIRETAWSGYMVLVKAMMASAVALSIAGATAQAADPVYAAPAGQTQASPTNPYLPYSYTRLPGPKASGSNWIPSSTPQPQPAPNSSGVSANYPRQGAGS